MRIYNTNNRILVCILFMVLLCTACEREKEYDVLSGQLIGYVTLYDNHRVKLTDHSGVEIIAEGSNPLIKATTDENGQFIMDGLNSGIYNIVFRKDGYCQHKIVSYQFVGGNKPATIGQTYLYCQSNFQISGLAITGPVDQYNPVFKVTASISGQVDNTTSLCRYYLSNEPDVSYRNYISTDLAYCYSGNPELSFYLLVNTLKYPVGSELFMIMYPASDTYLSYTDINTGNLIYTTVNTEKPSAVVSITIPEIVTPW